MSTLVGEQRWRRTRRDRPRPDSRRSRRRRIRLRPRMHCRTSSSTEWQGAKRSKERAVVVNGTSSGGDAREEPTIPSTDAALSDEQLDQVAGGLSLADYCATGKHFDE